MDHPMDTKHGKDSASNIFLETQNKYQDELERLKAEGDDLIEHLNEMLAKKTYVEDKIRSICKLAPTLKVVKRQAEDLVGTVDEISESSEKISGKIRSLDEARNRVGECQQRVSDLSDLKLCSQGVESAIMEADYETGAAFVHRFLSMDQSLLKRTANDVNFSNTLKFVRTLEEATRQLRHIVKHEFNQAIEKEEFPAMEKFFKLFPLLGMYDEGIESFCTYLRTKVAEAADRNIQSAISTPQTDKRYSVVYADALLLLFEGLRQILEDHQPLIETYYGPGRLISAVKVLQKECDKQVKRIFFEWDKSRRIHKKIEQTDYKKMSSSSSFGKLEKIPLLELDVVINEIALMHSRCEFYIKYVQRKVWVDVDVGIQDQSQRESVKKSLVQLIKDSEFIQYKHDLLSRYLMFEQYYMEESIAKVISMDALEENKKNSNMVDYSFYIVRKCIRRSISSGSLEGICVVINNACSVLEGDYCQFLKSRLSQGYPSGYADVAYSALQSSIQQGRFQSGDTEQLKTSFIVALNNADTSPKYIEGLCTKVVGEIETHLPGLDANERAKLESCLSGLSSVTVQLRDLVNNGMRQLHSTVIKPRVCPWVDAFLTFKHELSEEQLSSYEADDTFVAQLIRNLDALLASFREVLTAPNFDYFTHLLADEVTYRFEKVVLRTTYNRLGGLLLDREVRTLAGYVAEAASWSARDKFARLLQTATLLNLESVNEIRDYDDGGFVWRLTAAERRNILSLRMDFKRADLDNLRLA